MASVRESVQQIKDAVTRATQSGTEPSSGVQGAGTADQPYDQGNALEQPRTAGAEPPSGQQGRGTINEPYDLGNAAEQPATLSATEPVSGLQGRGTREEPYDQGNQTEQVAAQKISSSGTHQQSFTNDPLASPSTNHQGSGNPQMAPAIEQEQITHQTRGRDETAQLTTNSSANAQLKSTGTAAQRGCFDADKLGAGLEARRLRYDERDVSPGEMRDGSHAKTSGDRGESYSPGKLNLLKDKLHLGRHGH